MNYSRDNPLVYMATHPSFAVIFSHKTKVPWGQVAAQKVQAVEVEVTKERTL